MLGLTIVGRDASTTVIGGAQHLWDNGQKIVGMLVLFTAVIAPALQIGLMLAIVAWSDAQAAAEMGGNAAALSPDDPHLEHDRGHDGRRAGRLGQIADYATVIPGMALFVLWVLVFILAGMSASFELQGSVGADPMGGRSAARTFR